MSNPIGAMATIRWNGDTELSEDNYISFEQFPEGADPDEFVLPLAQIPDHKVFAYYNDLDQFLKIAKNPVPGADYEIVDFVLITQTCDAEANSY